ncbi:hypothetical protein ACLOJK_027171, partial [Asimina triloba]
WPLPHNSILLVRQITPATNLESEGDLFFWQPQIASGSSNHAEEKSNPTAHYSSCSSSTVDRLAKQSSIPTLKTQTKANPIFNGASIWPLEASSNQCAMVAIEHWRHLDLKSNGSPSP